MEGVSEEEVGLCAERTNSKRVSEANRRPAPYETHSNCRFVGSYPLYVSRIRGDRCVEGNERFKRAFGVLVRGHAHPKPGSATRRAEEAQRPADLLCERFGLETVGFSSMGLEATHHSARVTCAYTLRKKFKGCYHGSHDTLLVGLRPAAKGVGEL